MASLVNKKKSELIVRCFEVGEPRLHEKGHTIYKVTLKSIRVDKPDEDVQEVVVWRRYNDFKKLYKAMFHLHKALQRREEFPPFARSQMFGRFNEDVIKERQQSAQDLLNFVGQKSYLVSSKPFKQFFQGGEEVFVNPYSDPVLEPVKMYDDDNDSQSEPTSTAASLSVPSMPRVESSGSLGGVWKYRQAADEISIDDFGDDETDFTDESSLGTPLPDTEMSFFDPLHPVSTESGVASDTSGECNDSWLLSALSACAELNKEDQSSSAASQDDQDCVREQIGAEASHANEGQAESQNGTVADLSEITDSDLTDGKGTQDETCSNYSETSSMWDEFDPLAKSKTSKVEIGKGDLPFSLVDKPSSSSTASKPEVGKGDLAFGLMGSSSTRLPPDGEDSSPIEPVTEPKGFDISPFTTDSAAPKNSPLNFWSSTPKDSPQHRSAASSAKSSPAKSPRKQLMTVDLGERGTYIIQAAKQISLAQQCEANGNYHMAFTYFKSGIGTLITGVQGDDNKARREVVRRKTARYLLKAEDIYNTYLQGDKSTCSTERWQTGEVSPVGELDPEIATLQGSTTELLQFTVLGIIDKAMLVLHKITNETYIMKVLHKNSVLGNKKTIVPYRCPYMVELLRFYETDASIYLLLQHASGGKLWNYVSGYLQQHNDSHLEGVLDDIHERKLRGHKPGVGSDASYQTLTNSTSAPTVVGTDDRSNVPTDAQLESALAQKQELCNRQESTTEVDSLLEDNYNSGLRMSLGKKTSCGLEETSGNQDNESFCDILKAADISVNAFSISSFDSDGGAGSRINSTTSDHVIESIPEAQCEVSPSHTNQQKQSEGEVFNSLSNENGAKDKDAQKDPCDNNIEADLSVYTTLKGAEAAIQSANQVLNEGISESRESIHKPVEHGELNFILPEVPKDYVSVSNEEISIYDLHKPEESGCESASPERPSNLIFDKRELSHINNPKTSTPNGKSRHSSSSMSSPRDPEREPVIYRLPSQERSLESEVRPRKRNLSSVFRDLDLAEGEARSTVHLPEGCVAQWAAEITVAIGYIHSLGLVCKDLRPDNILLGERGHVLLTFVSQWRCVDGEINDFALNNFYTAPEVGSVHEIGPAADWWSLGAILFELLTGKTLESCFPGGLTSHSTIQIPEHLSPEASSFLQQLLKCNPNERLGVGVNGTDDVKHHAFFSRIDWTTLSGQ